MRLKKLTERVTKELSQTLPADMPQVEREAIVDLVRQAMLDASSRTTREMKETAVVVCGHEADLAHKLQEQMDSKRNMLIANLSAMR